MNTNEGVLISECSADLTPGALRVVRRSALVVMGIGLAVLVGWVFDIPLLMRIHPRLISMKVNAALSFVACGASLYLLTGRPAGRRVLLARALGLAAAALGLVTLSQFLFGSNLGIDQWLVPETFSQVAGQPPGRMPWVAALNFVLMGSALALFDCRRRKRLWRVEVLTLLAAWLTLLGVFDYLLDLKGHSTGMAMHGVLAFGVLCAGLLAARPNHLVAGLLRSPGPGGQSARRLLPAAVVLVLAVFATRWLGERFGLYGEEFGVVLSGCLIVGLVAAIIVWNASSLDVTDRQRRRAENELRRLNRALRVLSECNQALLRTASERELMTSVCRTIVEIGGYRFAWAGSELPDNPDVIEPVAHWGHEEGYLEVLRQGLRISQGRSLTARAIRAGKPSVVHDTATDASFELRREEALQRGYASAIALPLVRGARCIGSLNIYSAHKDAFDQQEADLLFELAHDLAFGIETLRARAQREKAESELDRFFNIAGDLLAVAGVDGFFKRVNPAFVQTLGWSIEELLTIPFTEFIHPEDRQRTRAEVDSLKRGSTSTYFENRYRCKDGSYRWLSWNSRPVAEEALIYTAARDVTARKQASEYARSLIEASLDPLVTISPEGKVTDVNEATIKVTGVPREKLIGTDFSDYFTQPEKAREGYQQVFSKGYVTDYPLTIRHRDGRLTDVLYNASVYKDAEGRVLGVFAAARDVTEAKRAEEEIRKLNADLEQRVAERTAVNRDLEAFTYSVSHDLRAPLRHMEGFARILSEECAEQLDEQARHYVSRILDGALHMACLVEDLLNLSHTGRRELQPRLAGLNTLVEESVRELAHEAEGRQVEWRIGRLPFVECDPALMKQVFLNLLGNALKFTRPREQAVIEVGEELRDGHSRIFVRDNGVGFNMKYADKLFKLFQRLHRVEDFEGTGVGLVTVERIVRKHGGSVWAEAELGQGACFYFTLEGRAVTEPEPAARAAAS